MANKSDLGTQYTAIIPVYRNEGTLESLVDALTGIADELHNRLEAVFVVDGSPDRSYLTLRKLVEAAPFPSQLISLSRNFGSFPAIRMGLECGKGPFYAVLAADLQEPPELIVTFFHTLDYEPFDVVVGTRDAREDPWWQSLSAGLFWALYRRFVQPEVPRGGVDVFGCNQVVRDALLHLRESNSTLIGLLFWLGFRRKSISYIRRRRAEGRSSWTFRRKLRYLLDSCFALTDLPVMVISAIGLFGSVISGILTLVVFFAWLAGRIPVPGYTPVILVLLNSFAATMLALGVIGNYVWRTFENTKNRPLYVPMMHETFEGSRHHDRPNSSQRPV
jgi:glycosyltransferase involved in cell wall biosynthesis